MFLYKGFSLGFTVSGICYTLGLKNGIICSISLLFIQNVLFLPAISTMGVSSLKLYKTIVNDRVRENMKMEFLKHSIISILAFIILIISAFLESNFSIKILEIAVKNLK